MKHILITIAILYSSAAMTQEDNQNFKRVTSIYVSQDFINEQLKAHNKAKLIKEMKLELDSKAKVMYLRGLINLPVEEMRAVNIDPSLGAFRFQVTILPSTTPKGHLILDFPLDQTYLYPANSKGSRIDRIIVPVQMISLVLASARGYLSALSGDFSSFDRQERMLRALDKGLASAAAREKNADAKQELLSERQKLDLQIKALPVERKQLEAVSKQVEKIIGFTGEKELNLNEELGARKNGLILKIKLAQLTPYLDGVELGGVRIVTDKKDGGGENYLAIDVNSIVEGSTPVKTKTATSERKGMKVAPTLIIRVNQALFESEALLKSEKKATGSKLENFLMSLQDDGLHVSGKWHTFFFSIPFDTIVDFATTELDVFEVRVRSLDVAGLDLEFLSKYILEAMQKRLELALKGICKFSYVGVEKDNSRALRVQVQPEKLVPAFPDLHLVAVDVRDGEFLMKIGKAL